MRYFLSVLFFFALISSDAQESQAFVIKPYLQFASSDKISILWETKLPARAKVYYGKASYGANAVMFDHVIELPGISTMHEVRLKNLNDTSYYFWKTVSYTTTDSLVSETSTFATAVSVHSAFMFALIGDTQRNSKTPWAWAAIAEQVWAKRPNFVVHAGDLVDKGMQKSDWVNDFFAAGHQLMSKVPLYPVLGNHEQDAGFYYEYTALPNPGYYYTFKYGNAQFFMIDSNREVGEGSEQFDWLEWALANSKADWKFVVHHHPPYTSDSDDYGDTRYSRSFQGGNTRNLVSLYEKYGVDMCFFGHTHLYERSWPIASERVDLNNGVIYINSGGAGGGIESFAPVRSWFTAELQAIHHFCTINIFEKTLQFKAIDFEGRLMDVFQINKSDKALNLASSPPGVHILTKAKLFSAQTKVAMEAAYPGLEIHYTLDGSEPGTLSPRYEDTLIISKSCTIKARAINKDGTEGRITSLELRRQEPEPALKSSNIVPGLNASYYEGDWVYLPDFRRLKPQNTSAISTIELKHIPHREDYFGVVMEGFVRVNTTGLHSFYLNSDDGSKLLINDKLIIDHDGCHSALSRGGQAMLQQGWHKIRIEYFERTGSSFLEAGIELESGQKVPFESSQLGNE